MAQRRGLERRNCYESNKLDHPYSTFQGCTPMKRQRFHYAVSGYRWAPESFQASKSLAGQPGKEIPLSSEERYELGRLFLTGYAKHVERIRERQYRSTITYAFRAKEAPRQLIYCPKIYCRFDASLQERLRVFKEIRRVLEKNHGRVTISTSCELDGEYRPTNIKENFLTVDYSRPLRISMGKKPFQTILEPPFHFQPAARKKARPHKHRGTSPVR